MKNRSKDVPYCGVDKEKIINANPTLNQDILAHMYQFIVDRYNTHKNKDVVKSPPPWTDNVILQQVKFTNIKRYQDRQSLNVINNITSKNDVSLKDRFFNIILMRFWNKYQSFELATGGKLLSFPLSDQDFNDCIKRIEANSDHTWWSGAYYTCPVRSWLERIHFEKKIPSSEINFSTSPIYFARYALTDELWNKIESANSPKEVFDTLTSIPWMGAFLVYQWIIDFTYCEDYWFSENEFTVSGPGCTKGLNLLFKDRDGMTHEECLFWLRDHQFELLKPFGYDPYSLFDDLPEYDRVLTIMDLENIFCELQKYLKNVEAVRIGKKPRGKSNYNGLAVKVSDKQPAVNLFDMGV
jgi:hypothetical protein